MTTSATFTTHIATTATYFSTIDNYPATNKTAHTTTEAIVVLSIIFCPVRDTTTATSVLNNIAVATTIPGSGLEVSPGNNAGHSSSLPGIKGTRICSATHIKNISPAFNGVLSFTVSGVVSALGAIAALGLFF
ncbi:hypothetical protein PENCOP_c001G07901 [Penicillium coprophilum]|uniref:Uncharacterized protein n=1 Tax=Penicillium coprophilum TaxID=36646 RepID=A0A1V6V6W5_9EURO|nr:hypothetical protein PENCOP_c001G07901 [Penicillium coprophilum]